MVLCLIFTLICCVYHTITITHTRVLAHAFIAKLFVQIRRNKQMVTSLWNCEKGPRLRLLSRLFIFRNVKKLESRSFTKQTNKGDTENMIYIEIHGRPKKSSQTKFSSETKNLADVFFHHDMRFVPFCLAFISLRAEICLILLRFFLSRLARILLPVFLLQFFVASAFGLFYVADRNISYNMCVCVCVGVRASVCLCAVNRHQFRNVHEQ